MEQELVLAVPLGARVPESLPTCGSRPCAAVRQPGVRCSPQSGLEWCKGACLISPHQGTGVAADTRQHHTSWTVGAL